MLKIDIKPIKGVLFVRLSGNLNKKNIRKLNNEVLKLQKLVEIKNIVFNISELESIDNYGENALIKSFNICKLNRGQGFICLKDNQKIFKQVANIFDNNILIKDELAAINQLKY